MAIALFFLYLIFTLSTLYHGVNRIVWEVGSAIYLIIATFLIGMPLLISFLLWIVIIGIIVILQLSFAHNALSEHLYNVAKRGLPKLSTTEEEALNAGDTWIEQDIFRGKPNWQRLHDISTRLTPEEESFLKHEVETLCSMLNEWEITQSQDLPDNVWSYIKEKGFLGIVIAKEYGGKGFSARAHSDIVIKIASRSGSAAVTVMVPNSLGPGELLQHYGTDEQKSYYLPRLATGIEIPCFALTEPGAGSDATSIESDAIVIKKNIDGRDVLGLNITLNKRWITLAPVATLIGLAVNLKDPDGLLQGVGREGITCLLIPRDTKNLEIGNRHLPADQPFMNGSIRGENLFVGIDSIIGGQEQAGHGWRMLVECLSIGRSISLPALSTASSAISYLTTGAFARIRRQFNVEIAQFEGVEEKLAEIAGLNYLINATRLLTAAAVNQHKKPSVASAITKYFNTELARIVINNAMDVHAGRAVVVGPRNYMTGFYLGIPISVTVEGANIMSRNLLIFGQGSMACHPFIRDEFRALLNDDKQTFNALIWQHLHYFVQNFSKALCSAWTGGLFISTTSSILTKEHKQLTRLSHTFAWIADLSLMYLGGSLKRKERLSARLADALSYLYMAMAILNYTKQYADSQDEKQLHARWALSYCFHHAQKAMIHFSYNFPSRFIGRIIRLVAFPWGQSMRGPDDKLSHQLAQDMIRNNPYRNAITKQVYLSGDPNQPVDRVEVALQALIEHDALYCKIKDLKHVKFGKLKVKLRNKVDEGQLTQKEMDTLVWIEKLRWDAIQVDEFSFKSMQNKTYPSLTDEYKNPMD